MITLDLQAEALEGAKTARDVQQLERTDRFIRLVRQDIFIATPIIFDAQSMRNCGRTCTEWIDAKTRVAAV